MNEETSDVDRLERQYNVTGSRRSGNNSWIIPALLAVAFFLLFVSLGRWQLSRAGEKDILVASFEHGHASDVMQGPLGNEAAANHIFKNMAVYGHYDESRQFLLDNMTHEGRVGYEVLTPFKPVGEQRSLLVNRGWVPLEKGREVLPETNVGIEERTVTGRIGGLPKAGVRLGPGIDPNDSGWPRLAQFPEMAELKAVLDYPLFDYVLRLNPDQPDGYVREWRATVMSADQHRGYAIQWFAMAAVVLIIFMALSRRSLTPRNPGNE